MFYSFRFLFTITTAAPTAQAASSIVIIGFTGLFSEGPDPSAVTAAVVIGIIGPQPPPVLPVLPPSEVVGFLSVVVAAGVVVPGNVVVTGRLVIGFSLVVCGSVVVGFSLVVVVVVVVVDGGGVVVTGGFVSVFGGSIFGVV